MVFQIIDMIIVHLCQDHLKTGLFLYSQHFSDTSVHHFHSGCFEHLISPAEYNIHFHMGCTSHSIDIQQHPVTGLTLQFTHQQTHHFLSCIVGRNQSFLSATAFSMLSHTDLHDSFGQIGNRCVVLGMGTFIHSYSQCS